MKNKTAFLTTIFPMERCYLFEFFDSLRKQTYTKFDVIVINDNYEGFSEIKEAFSELNLIELFSSGTPAENRAHGINYVINAAYENLIFGDSDDYFDANRVQVSIDILCDYDIVVNDLSLFKNNGIYCEKYISNRIQNKELISLDFIKDKNIFGLSNTAVKVSALDPVNFEQDLIAVDWYFFSTLLLKNLTAVFTNQTQTYYRQYESNTIGIGINSQETFLKTRQVKSKHYSLLVKKSSVFKELYECENDLDINDLQDGFFQQKNKTPFWWEE